MEGILAPMTTPTGHGPATPTNHRQAALDNLEAAKVARQLCAAEYGKPHGKRDYTLTGELRSAARHHLLEAQVHALLASTDAPRVVMTTDNTHDYLAALRRLHLDRLEAVQTHGSDPNRNWLDVDVAEISGVGDHPC